LPGALPATPYARFRDAIAALIMLALLAFAWAARRI
jgi:hypothetical protein